MLTYKLVHLIEYHSQNLAATLVRRVEHSERAGSYRNAIEQELQQVVNEIYHHLGAWLLNKTESDIEQRYTTIGARRAQQGVPLSELVWVIFLTKRNLAEFINDISIPGRAVDASERQEMLQLLDQFFEEAIHAAVVGYGHAPETQKQIAVGTMIQRGDGRPRPSRSAAPQP